MAIQILLTAMISSFLFGAAAMVYDVEGGNLSKRAANVVSVLYLWPLAVVGMGIFVLAITLIWRGHP